jgi:hypothetical protein
MSEENIELVRRIHELDTCEYVGSAVVRASGFVWTRRYSCPVRRTTGRASKFLPAPLP